MADQPTSVSTTAAVSYGAVGGGAVVMWFFQCVAAGHIIPPDNATALIMAGAIAPFLHAVGRAIAGWFTKKTGIPISLADLTPQQIVDLEAKVTPLVAKAAQQPQPELPHAP